MHHIKSKKLSVLLIDDHPLIVDAYKTALYFYSKQNDGADFNIMIAQDCDSALNFITDFYTDKRILDLVFLDISLPPSKNDKILSGEDLGIKIKELLPEAKIIISTTFNNNYRIHSIIKSVDPDAFLIKNDLKPKELLEVINSVLYDPPYYTKSVIKLLRNSVANDLLVDKLDRQILYQLSLGTRMIEIAKVVPLSKTTIEKRKRHLKEIFNIKSLDDRELIAVAKEKGFI